MCGDHWDVHFDRLIGARTVMHAAADIPLKIPSNTELQRALFSDDDGGPCAKRGSSNQLCGWIRGIPLMTGRITDSQMIKDSEVLVKFSTANSSSTKPLTKDSETHLMQQWRVNRVCNQGTQKGTCNFLEREFHTQLVLLSYVLEMNVLYNAARCLGS